MNPLAPELPAVLQSVLSLHDELYPGLGEVTPSLVAEAAKLTACYGDEANRAFLSDLPERLRSATVNEVLSADWPAQPNRLALIDRCVDMLLNGCDQRLLAWAVLQEQLHGQAYDVQAAPPSQTKRWGWAEFPFPMSAGYRRALQAECRRVLLERRSDDPRERAIAACLLVAQECGGAKVERTIYEELLRDDDPGVWGWASTGMIRFNERERLAGILRARPRRDWMAAIEIMRNGAAGQPGEAEADLWLATARAFPGPMASLLQIQARVNPVSIPGPLRDLVRDFLVRELEASGPVPGVSRQQAIVDAVYVLNHWHNPDDTELLRRYLAYPHPLVTDRKDESGVRTEVKDFPVRIQAARMLMARGEEVPAEVVFREDASSNRAPLVDPDPEC